MKNNKRPKMRFSGFSEDWEVRNLKEVSERVRGNDKRMDLPTLTISAGSGWLDQRERFSGNIAGNEQKNYTLLSKGELSYNHGNSKLAKYGAVFVLRTFEEALVPKIYHSFRTTEEASADFIESMFATKKPDKELAKLISSGARMDGLLNINYEEFASIKITIPKVEEQIQIARFLRELDKTITLHQQELDTLKRTKQGFLQKMFPKEGKSVPEFRFPGFTEGWEQHKIQWLIDEGIIEKPMDGNHGEKHPTASDYIDHGIPFLMARDIKKGIVDLKNCNFISRERSEKLDKGFAKNGDVLITHKATIGEVAILNGLSSEYAILTPQVTYYRVADKSKLATKYLYSYFISLEFQNIIKIKSTQSTRSYIGITEQYKLDIKLPKSIKEQEEIGNFFSDLDNLITLHQCELDALKKTKIAFLQKMFV